MIQLLVLSPLDAPEPFKVSFGQAPIKSSSLGSFSSFALHSSTRSGSRLKLKRKKSPKVFLHCLKPFLKYFIWRKKSRKISFKRSLRAHILEDQVPDLLAANCVFAQPLVHSSSFKEFLETNPDLLEVSCTQLQALARSGKSDSNCSHPMQFKYAEFSLLNSKVKFLRGSPSKTPLEKGEVLFRLFFQH